MQPYRVAIIGTGAIADNHVQALRAAGDRAQLVAGVDVDETRLKAFCAQQAIPSAYTDAAAMLAEARPDLVHIATPPATHAPLAIQCLEAGAWVHCEKPLCGSLAEFDQLSAAEQRTGRYVSTVFQWRFGSAGKHLKRLIESGELGRPLVGVCQTLWYRPPAYYAVPWRGKWQTEVGGVSTGHGIHLMDLFLWLMGGDWQTVHAMAAIFDRDIEVENVSMALVRFAGGAMGSITNSVVSPRQESYLRLDFQRATASVTALYSYQNADWRFSIPEDAPDDRLLARWGELKQDIAGSHAAQVADLLDSMDAGARPLVSGPEARRILEFLASLYKSAFTHQEVARGSITPDDPFYQSMNGGMKLAEGK
jgi:predicted dehydrogenase